MSAAHGFDSIFPDVCQTRIPQAVFAPTRIPRDDSGQSAAPRNTNSGSHEVLCSQIHSLACWLRARCAQAVSASCHCMCATQVNAVLCCVVLLTAPAWHTRRATTHGTCNTFDPWHMLTVAWWCCRCCCPLDAPSAPGLDTALFLARHHAMYSCTKAAVYSCTTAAVAPALVVEYSRSIAVLPRSWQEARWCNSLHGTVA
jgi:hypothetical protein